MEQEQQPIDPVEEVPEKIPLTPGQRASLVARVVLTIALLAATGLMVLAWVLPFKTDHEAQTGYDTAAFVGFFTRVYQFELGIAVAVLAAFLLMLRCWKRCLLAIVLTVAAVGPDLWVSREKSPPAANGAALRVMSMSLIDSLRDAAIACDAIMDQKPDLVSVQEVTPKFAGELDNRLSVTYPYRIVQPKDGYDGLAIFSKLPITLDDAPLESGKRWLRATLTWNDQPVSFYAIHLAPPQTVDGSRANRWQVGQLLAETGSKRRPVLLAGDFNFTIMTPQAMALRNGGFIDAHDVAGRDSGDTWPTAVANKVVPAVRIDTVYYRGPINATASRVAQRFGSDHLPVVIDLTLADPKKAPASQPIK